MHFFLLLQFRQKIIQFLQKPPPLQKNPLSQSCKILFPEYFEKDILKNLQILKAYNL